MKKVARRVRLELRACASGTSFDAIGEPRLDFRIEDERQDFLPVAKCAVLQLITRNWKYNVEHPYTHESTLLQLICLTGRTSQSKIMNKSGT